ncbi:MAG: class I SAM-dependent methyltransferase, partial [Clostridiales bacterium]|nr:class I SAM-dependent methyltransferase [Clostridiales bacterium]
MNYPRSEKYQTPELLSKIMGPNPVKLEEELLLDCAIPQGSRVCDLGSGQGLTSVFLAKEYGFTVYAADLWSDPEENRLFFRRMGLRDDQIIPVKADATDLPFEEKFFDGIISTDSYNYFGRDPAYLDQKLLPFVKPGGYVYIAIPGMKRDCHDHLPPELLLSWTPEQLDYMHDTAYWRTMVGRSRDAELLEVSEMES